MRRVLLFVGVAIGGLALGFGVVALGGDGGLDETHLHGPDTHTHGENGEVITVRGEPPSTAPEFPDIDAEYKPVNDSGGRPIDTEAGPLVLDVAGLAAAEMQWIEDGGDLDENPPPTVVDDEWLDPPTNHPLDPRWYTAYESVLEAAAE